VVTLGPATKRGTCGGASQPAGQHTGPLQLRPVPEWVSKHIRHVKQVPDELAVDECWPAAQSEAVLPKPAAECPDNGVSDGWTYLRL